MTLPFWKTKRLEEMNRDEWESVCDGCGKCCLHKLQEEDTDVLFYTSVACRLLDCDSCLCSDYPNRRKHVPDCVKLTRKNIADIDWMPSTCAYRLLRDGEDLPEWHPLITGDPKSTVKAGMSVSGRVTSELDANPNLELYIVDWPS